MPAIFKALRWFVVILVVSAAGIFFLPRGSALRPRGGFVDQVVNQAVCTFTETVDKELGVDLNKINSQPVVSGKDGKVVPLHSVLEN